MAKMDFVVTVDPQRQLDQLAKSLEDKGLQILKKFPRSGTIIGTGDSSLSDALKSVDGVEAVREERQFRLPPMDDKVPQ